MFRIWIGLTVAVAAYVAIMAPLTSAGVIKGWPVASVALWAMFPLLAIGLAWLVWFVNASRRTR